MGINATLEGRTSFWKGVQSTGRERFTLEVRRSLEVSTACWNKRYDGREPRFIEKLRGIRGKG